jgi:hypothetical protein
MSYCWRSLTRLRSGGLHHQPGPRREAGFHPCGFQEPLAEAQPVQSHCRQDVPTLDPRQADIAAPSQARAPYPVRDGAFDPCSARELRLTRRGLSALPGHLQVLFGRLGPDSRRPPRIARLRTPAWANRSPRRPSLVENFTLMTAFPRLSTAGVHPVPVLPAGQVVHSRSQSIRKCWASKPAPARACQGSSRPVWPKRATPSGGFRIMVRHNRNA